MARITVEDCLEHEQNRFTLVRLASRRAKQLLSGRQPVTDTKGNKAVVSALREIADGKVRFKKASVTSDDSGAVSGTESNTSEIRIQSGAHHEALSQSA